jgi:hypothetical protein
MFIDLIDVYQYHSPQIEAPKNSTHNMWVELYIYIHFFKFCDGIILSQIYSMHSNFLMFVELFK